MKRFIHSDNGTLKDYSTELKNYHSGSAVIDYTVTADAIYIGSELPFNSLFFDISVANDQAATPTVQYWDGGNWRSMVEVIDETNGLFNSGHITWTTNKSHNWANEDTVYPSGTEQITGLGNVTIYNLYWLKITFNVTLKATTALNWIGPKFCDDNDVTGEFTLFSKSGFLTAYESGKTSWEREIILASNLIIEKLIDKDIIISGDQLLERSKLRDACVSKVAELIFNNLGDDYEDDRKKARAEYDERMNKKNFRADINQNARIDEQEMGVMVGGLYR